MPARTGVIDQNPAHELRGKTDELCAALPVQVLLIEQAQVGFVNQRRPLQRVALTLTSQLSIGKPAQLPVDQRSTQRRWDRIVALRHPASLGC